MSNEQTVEPRQKRSIEKKQKLIEAGLKLFSEKGYAATTIADLAKEAGVSVGIVYRYFGDKKDILLDGMEAAMADFEKLFKEEIEITPDTTMEDFLKQYLVISYQAQSLNSPVFFSEITAMAFTDRDVADMFAKFNKVIKDLFSTAVYQLVDMPEYADEKTEMVMNLLTNHNHSVVYGEASDEKKFYMEKLVITTATNILLYK